MNSEQVLQIKALIGADPVRMSILSLVQSLGLPDCWVGAGFLRSAVWDHLHQRAHSPLPSDIDVIWFDPGRATVQTDTELEACLRNMDASYNWSVKNQARMHLRNSDTPYASAIDAIRFWPETATAIAIRLDSQGALEVAAPLGLEDLLQLVVRPTARFQIDKREIYLERMQGKDWLRTWPNLKFTE